MSTTEKIVAGLRTVRERHPLVHNITNYVVMNCTANTLLALGASPVMAHAVEEVEEMAALSGAVVLNIGTLSTPWIEAMFRAGHAARAKGIPVILDPVGAGTTTLRTDAPPPDPRGQATVIRATPRRSSPCATATSRPATPTASHRRQAHETARYRSRYRCRRCCHRPEDHVTDGTARHTSALASPAHASPAAAAWLPRRLQLLRRRARPFRPRLPLLSSVSRARWLLPTRRPAFMAGSAPRRDRRPRLAPRRPRPARGRVPSLHEYARLPADCRASTCRPPLDPLRLPCHTNYHE